MTDTTELLKVLRKVQERCFMAEEENWAHDILSIVVPVLDEASPMPQPASTVEAGDALREARELLCQRCGQEYRVWCAASPLWNAVVRGGSIDGREEYAFLCPNCFMALAEDRNIASLFQVRAARTIKLETVTPSGREWNDAEFAFTPALAKLDTTEKGMGNERAE